MVCEEIQRKKKRNKSNCLFLFNSGHRANKIAVTIDKTNRSIMGRMLGAVSNSVKIGSYMLDSVQQRTNDVIHNALH